MSFLFRKPAAADGDADLSALVLAEHNAARTNPKEYAKHLKPLLTCFDGDLLKRKGRPTLRTAEGKKALEEAIKFLSSAEPSPPLEGVSAGMSAAAADHAADLASGGATSHTGADGSSPFDRISRYGRWSGTAAENLAFGMAEDPAAEARSRTIQLIVDDGVPSRGHRDNMFNPSFKWLGVAFGPHALGRSLVVTFAEAFTEGPAERTADARAAAAAAATAAAAAAAEKTASESAMADDGAVPTAPPPGGKMQVKRSTVKKGKKETVTTMTTITDAAGNVKTYKEVVEKEADPK